MLAIWQKRAKLMIIISKYVTCCQNTKYLKSRLYKGCQVYIYIYIANILYSLNKVFIKHVSLVLNTFLNFISLYKMFTIMLFVFILNVDEKL